MRSSPVVELTACPRAAQQSRGVSGSLAGCGYPRLAGGHRPVPLVVRPAGGHTMVIGLGTVAAVLVIGIIVALARTEE
jgi:hypothetical protein